jgi:hypothetical protein
MTKSLYSTNITTGAFFQDPMNRWRLFATELEEFDRRASAMLKLQDCEGANSNEARLVAILDDGGILRLWDEFKRS